LGTDPLQLSETLEALLHIEMGRQTSACLYGSAVSGEWVAGRSDLDLLVLVPEEKLELLGEKLKIWHSVPARPLLDGYVLYSSGNRVQAKELHALDRPPHPAESFVPLIDGWNIKNRSKYLFGEDLSASFRDISQGELRVWAIRDIGGHWIPFVGGLVSQANRSSESRIPLSTLICLASGVARILMLANGTICSSKREALRWLANECVEIREMVYLLIEDFEKPDDVAGKFTIEQAVDLGRSCLRLLHEVKR
jgi:hypothetical protein